ncbi:hypothetical protein ACIOWI_29805 [Streptomyces sp. NPDC087659]|uniref:hypothetical protein n=1 Tax=Streptomyces sp. NPDC087659 TaxID=3365801 RepID=UPI00381E9A9F
MPSVQITGTGQLLELSRRLKTAGGPRLRANLARRIRRAAEPMHRDLQQSITGLQITSQSRRAGKRGGPSPTTRPLRAGIAAAIRISVRTGANPGARVWVDPSRLPSGVTMGVVARLNEGRLRHPVFGNDSRWVQQNAAPGWWTKTAARHTPRMRAEVERVLNDVRNSLT